MGNNSLYARHNMHDLIRPHSNSPWEDHPYFAGLEGLGHLPHVTVRKWLKLDLNSSLIPVTEFLPLSCRPEQDLKALKMAGTPSGIFAIFGDPTSCPSSLDSHASVSFRGFTFPHGVNLHVALISIHQKLPYWFPVPCFSLPEETVSQCLEQCSAMFTE